ncbi:VanW family protein [Nocardioides sp. SYSU D00038]|uniref:VanW family protein n=1 Tax=Nocardioides sp. SYSU D00038 TaxID=2812554 RepID=UPI0019670710|nr:VanW family protein [Nocardioides sp. SYSU D00038]
MTTPAQTPERERAGGRLVLLVVLGLLVVAGAGYAAAYAVAGDDLPRGTSVAGVDIGGRSADAAVAHLEDELAERLAEPVQVNVDDSYGTVDADDVGFGIDLEATVAQADRGRSWSPGRLWDHFTGGEELEPVVEIDEERFEEFVDGLDEDAGDAPVDGTVTFRNGAVRTTDPEIGRGIDPEAAREAVAAAFLAELPRSPVELPLGETAPEIDQADVDEAVETFANPAMSGPVTLVFGKSPITLRPRQFGAALRLVPEGGALEPEVDVDKLSAMVDKGTSGRDEPVDATVRLVDGKPKVVKGKPGLEYEPEVVAEQFLSVVTESGDARRTEVEAEVAEPEFTTQDAKDLKIVEEVSSFTTYFPYAEYRNINIGRAAELITGTVLKPGETFSLNDTVGERTRENGFTEGFIISNGIFREDLGGGVSQMATTAFNAAFFAGLKDVEHKPHSFYIDRYPVGREATVAWGSVDLRFQNDTPYGVLIDARVTPSTPGSQGVVTVRMFSTKYWDIDTTTSDRYNFTSPGTRTLDVEDCTPNTGYGGFDVDVKRIFRKPGSSKVVKTENFHTTYIPSDTVICKPPGGGDRDRQGAAR